MDAPGAALVVARGVGGDAIEPACEVRVFSQAWQSLPGFEKGFLSEFGADGVVANHADEKEADALIVALAEQVEGAGVSPARLCDEFAVGWRAARLRRRWVLCRWRHR